MVQNSLSFCLSEKLLISLLYLNEILAGYSNLDCREIQPVHSEGYRSWVFFGRTETKAETPILWPPHAKSSLIGKD